MFSRSPYYSYHPSYDDYNYQNAYARDQAQIQAEQRRAQLALERQRQREAERRRAAALAAARRQERASQYLPEASMMYPGRNRSYVPERASRYLPDEFDHYGSAVEDDLDDDAYDYGFGRAGSYLDGWPTAPMPRERHSSKPISSHPQLQPRKPDQQRPRSRSRPTTVWPQPHPRSPSSSREQLQPHISEPKQRKSSPQPSSAAPKSPTTPVKIQISSPHSREKMEKAATKIQSAYRIHRAFSTIEALHRRFNELKSSFTFPSVLDFQTLIPEHHVTLHLQDITPSGALDALKSAGIETASVECISVPQLAYTHANRSLHRYVESLNRLLTSLDGVESYGEKRVREKRKEVVRAVEAEAGRVEGVWKQSWDDWVSTLKLAQASDDMKGLEDSEVKSIVMLDPPSTPRSRHEEELDEGFASASEDAPKTSEEQSGPDTSEATETSGSGRQQDDISADYVML
ncbi:hypothetical protein E1B28_013639 [Marasmius oreades]|uniref:BAG domain-containing protein n=1 Tax=Marasmius oreades TaxID=181124 RepID=A0A9P7UMF5_9AGAR|nr:uncharacterized protein E1B28_013639 [Marasmius oreades]KAG7087692.1 hypothetical protein E1B28_013639 [Marasmius oreades]